ncbi:MAG: hypothetical protein JWM74_6072 [Myxococcaceae bacterium]|nr:hypothetical protein [Myxococcaceae bacterium]
MKSVAIALATITALFFTTSARAQGNYRSSPLGGRTALMGDTGVAFGRDGAAPFTNPSTIVRIHDRKIALSVNLYSLSQTSYANFYRPGPVDASRFPTISGSGTAVGDTSLDALPSTTCFFFTVGSIGQQEDDGEDGPNEKATRAGRQKAAFCLANVERRDATLPSLNHNAGTGNGGLTVQGGSATRTWHRWLVGPTYAFNPTNDLSLGASLSAAYTLARFHDDNSTVTTGGPTGPIGSGFGMSSTGQSLDLNATIGATYKLLDRYTFAASIEVPSVHLTGRYRANSHEQYQDAAGPSSRVSVARGDYSAPPPVRLAAGIGMKVSEALKFELDGFYYFARDEAIASQMHVEELGTNGATATNAPFDVHYAVRSRAVANVAFGGELFVTPTFSVLGGASTDLTSTPPLATTNTLGTFDRDRLSRVSVSGGIGSYGGAGELLIGTQLSYGWGQALAIDPYVIPNQYAAIDMRRYEVMIILAGSTTLRAIKRAVTQIVDPTAAPSTPAPAPAPLAPPPPEPVSPAP